MQKEIPKAANKFPYRWSYSILRLAEIHSTFGTKCRTMMFRQMPFSCPPFGAVVLAAWLAAEIPGGLYVNPFSYPADPLAHETSIGPET